MKKTNPKKLKHIQFTAAESRLLCEAIGIAINVRENAIAGQEDKYPVDVEDIEKFKDLRKRVRKAPAGTLAGVREILFDLTAAVRPSKAAREKLQIAVTRAEITKRNHDHRSRLHDAGVRLLDKI